MVQARVYDGSDTGAKIYATMAVIGKEASKPSDDAEAATELRGIRRWPVVVSYFDEASKDAAPEYTLSFDLYENGVSGTLKDGRDILTIPIIVWAKGHVSVQTRDVVETV